MARPRIYRDTDRYSDRAKADNASFLKRLSTISPFSLFCRAYLLFRDEVVNLAVSVDIISNPVKSVECLK